MCCLMRLVSTHVSRVLQFYIEQLHQLNHCHPGKLHMMRLRANSSISRGEATTCTLPSLCDGVLHASVTGQTLIWPLEIYLSRSEDAP